MAGIENLLRDAVETSYADAFSSLWNTWDARVKGRATADYYRQLRRSQWLSKEEIEKEQLVALRALLSFAQTNVPYYRELFAKLGFRAEDVKKREDISVIPPLTREILLERKEDLRAPEYTGKTIKKSTSGSTGVPASFEYNVDSEAWRQAMRLRGWGFAGYGIAKPVLYYWGHATPPDLSLRGIKTRVDRALKREVYFDALRQDEASLREVVGIIERFHPSVIVCYPQAAAGLAHFITEKKLRTWEGIPVICGGEALLPQDREALVNAFGPHVFETYGARETMLMAAECEAHDGMHLSEENILLEVTRDGKPLPAGETGAVLVTDLHNYGMPFIRYENRDLATMKEDTLCTCRRGLRRLERVDGRASDILTGAKGTRVPGIAVNVLMTTIDLTLVRQFQIIQKKNGPTTLRIVRGPSFVEEKFRPMVTRLEDYLEGTKVAVEYVDEIPKTKAGKQRHVIVED